MPIEPPKDPNFHWTWIHTLFAFLGLSPLTAFKKVRSFLFGWLKKMIQKAAESEGVSTETFKTHVEGDKLTLSVITTALDQNSRISQDSAIQVLNYAKEMRETANLIAQSQKGMREEFDYKVGELHERINSSNQKVDNLTGKLEVLIPLVENQLKQGRAS